MGRRKGAPDVGPPRGVSPRRAPPDANIAASLGHYNALSLPPEFQHLLREHHQHPALRQTPR
jgi:hypothetical protein